MLRKIIFGYRGGQKNQLNGIEIEYPGRKVQRLWKLKTLKEWLENGYTPQIPVCNELPFNVTTRELSAIDPYLLGVLLGDAHLGTLSLACHEDDKIYYRKVFGEEDFSYTTQGYIRIIGSLKKHIIQKLKIIVYGGHYHILNLYQKDISYLP